MTTIEARDIIARRTPVVNNDAYYYESWERLQLHYYDGTLSKAYFLKLQGEAMELYAIETYRKLGSVGASKILDGDVHEAREKILNGKIRDNYFSHDTLTRDEYEGQWVRLSDVYLAMQEWAEHVVGTCPNIRISQDFMEGFSKCKLCINPRDCACVRNYLKPQPIQSNNDPI